MGEINKLTLKKDGLYAEVWVPPILKEEPDKDDDELVEWDESFFETMKKELKEKTIKEGYFEIVPVSVECDTDIFRHLRRICEIDENVTLRDIMNFVRKNEVLTNLIGNYSWAHSIEKYHELLDKEPLVSENVKELEISWVADDIVIHEKNKDKQLDITRPNLMLNHDFHGLGPAGEEAKNWGGNENDYIRWSVSGNIHDVLDAPIKLSKDSITYNKIVFLEKGGIDKTAILEGEADFTLLEILDAIYWDITFYGSPCDSEEFHKDLNEKTEIAMRLLEKEKDGKDANE